MQVIVVGPTGPEFLRSVQPELDETQSWEAFARILFRLNEFVYVR